VIGPTFSWPLRPWARFRIDAGFLDPSYLHNYGKNHRGADLNLVTGGDSDLGYPVSSMFPGTVTAAAVYGSWGGIVVVRADEWVRKMVSDRLERPIDVLEVQYAHLGHTVVDVGDTVNAGDCVGVIGKGTWGQYVAHLHLEVRAVELHPALPQGTGDEDYQKLRSQCLDPEVLLKRLPFSDFPTTLAQKAYYAPSRVLEVDHAGETGVLIHPIGDKVYLEGV
jgi:murein DD-endopeptidase MepM/ murein hydrolase activator NlpD